MPPVLKPAQAGDPEVRRPSGPDRLAVAIQNLAVPLTHSSRPRKRRDEIATGIHVSMSLALRRKGRPSAWCANPSDEIVRGPSDRVHTRFSNCLFSKNTGMLKIQANRKEMARIMKIPMHVNDLVVRASH